MTSNHRDALHLDSGDRRFFICPFSPVIDHRSDFDYWDELADWLLKNLETIHGYLLDVDMTGFAPYGRAPETAAKAEMIEASHSVETRFAHDLVFNRLETLQSLGLGDLEYVTTEELVELFHMKPSRSAVNRLGRALGDLNCERRQLRIEGKQVRAYKLVSGSWDAERCRRDLSG